MGIDEVYKYCESHPDVGALITRAGKQSGVVQITAVGLDESEWRQVAD